MSGKRKQKRKASSDLFLATGAALCFMGMVTVGAQELTSPTHHTGQHMVPQSEAEPIDESLLPASFRHEQARPAEPGVVTLWKYEDDWGAELERSLAIICETKKCVRRNGQLVLAEAESKPSNKPYGAN